MNKIINCLILTLMIVFASCNQKQEGKEVQDYENNEEASDVTDISENELLKNEVQKIHDEVMPKLQDIYNKKQALKKKLDEDLQLSAEQKEAINKKIARLDSAEDGMMDWMHKWQPEVADSDDQQKGREYLEDEMEKVKKVRDNILNALKEADQ